MVYKYVYPKPSVTVDCVLFGYDPNNASIDVLLIQRNGDPYKGSWALPGGFVEVGKDDDFSKVARATEESGFEPDQGESLEDAARRELEEETGTKIDFLEQLYTFGTPGRDPRGRVISVAYYALVQSKDCTVKADSDADDARWFPVDRTPSLAFDHADILEMAVKRLQSKVRYTPIGANLLPSKFSLLELQKLYESLLLRKLDKGNFRRKILSAGILTPAGTRQHGSKELLLYKFNMRAYNAASLAGFNFEPRYKKGE